MLIKIYYIIIWNANLTYFNKKSFVQNLPHLILNICLNENMSEYQDISLNFIKKNIRFIFILLIIREIFDNGVILFSW